MKIRFFTVTFFLVMLCSITTFAHPGRTDSSGGHYDRSTGEYHYHHGEPAHQHDEYGRCPYDTTDDDIDDDDSDADSYLDADDDQAPKSSSNDNVSSSDKTENEHTSLPNIDFIISIVAFVIIIAFILLIFHICIKDKPKSNIESSNAIDINFSSMENMETETIAPKKSQEKKSHSTRMRIICGVVIVLLAAYSVYSTYQLKRYSDALDISQEQYTILEDEYYEFLFLVTNYLEYGNLSRTSNNTYVIQDVVSNYKDKKFAEEYARFIKKYAGNSYVLSTFYEGANVYILNTDSKKMHLPSCSSIDSISPSFFDTSVSSIQDLEEQGYSKCKECFQN